MSGKPVVIIGAGGFGREILMVLDACDFDRLGQARPRFVGFVADDRPDSAILDELGARWLGGVEAMDDDVHYLIGVGNPSVRADVDARAKGEPWPAVVHNTAALGRAVSLEAGSVICAQSVITTNVVIGRHFHLNLTSTLGHDCVIGDYVTVAPGVNISGNVTVGDRVEFGTGSKVLPGVSIGDDSVIGAGAVVTKDVPAGVTAKGIPARWE